MRKPERTRTAICFSLQRWANLVVLLALCAPAAADEFAAIREQLETCFACHGENGASTQPKYPILAGQHFYYLYVQMKDFKAGRRASPEMAPTMSEQSRTDMKLMAKFFSEQNWPAIGFNADPAKARRGEVATASGQCVQCHRGGYEGDSRVPRLAGQHPTYLVRTMSDFKSKARANSPAKSSLMGSYDDDDIASMAEFLGEMRVR